ncbi:Cwf15/Cwc15 cell cycle control protein [Aureobasidium sp. EXF-12298]|nr:Cwf15/Cwc15 cell cycle control protein [Aureobasidium sp. EXF-12298]KAI4772919.1 Cwf15/Cwc15 cell cycle control protein [Aureobasidium sp. EXF-3400]
MTTAHRPTFDPARGKDALRGPGYHQRLLPAHKTLKFRQATQGTTDEHSARDLRAELLRAERRHFAKKEGRELSPEDEDQRTPQLAIEQGKNLKRNLEDGADGNGPEGEQDEEDYEAKRRRVLEETRDVDADSDDGSEEDSDSSDDEDDDDDEAELMRELAKIKAERAEAAAREAAEQAAKEEEQQMRDIATGNPLLNKGAYDVKRRWDDDVVFKNQARGTEDKKGKEFVNDLLRSDFHRRFMSKYVR